MFRRLFNETGQTQLATQKFVLALCIWSFDDSIWGAFRHSWCDISQEWVGDDLNALTKQCVVYHPTSIVPWPRYLKWLTDKVSCTVQQPASDRSLVGAKTPRQGRCHKQEWPIPKVLRTDVLNKCLVLVWWWDWVRSASQGHFCTSVGRKSRIWKQNWCEKSKQFAHYFCQIFGSKKT